VNNSLDLFVAGSSGDNLHSQVPPQTQQLYAPVKKDWKVGDKCLAIWSGDGQ